MEGTVADNLGILRSHNTIMSSPFMDIDHGEYPITDTEMGEPYIRSIANEIPGEILAQIFKEYLNLSEPIMTHLELPHWIPITFTRRRWRAIALEKALCWTSIRINADCEAK